MAKSDTLFKSAGICTHTSACLTITKIRYGTDYVRRVKLLSTPNNVKVQGQGLMPARVGLVELPEPMNKVQALAFLKSHPDFQSAEDQAIIQDEILDREPRPAKVPKAKKPRAVKAVAKETPTSLSSIRARGPKTVTVVDVLSAVVETAPVPSESEQTQAVDQ